MDFRTKPDRSGKGLGEPHAGVGGFDGEEHVTNEGQLGASLAFRRGR